MKKRLLLILTSAMVLATGITGCGKKQEAAGAATNTGLANPMVEADYESIVELTGANFVIPGDATDVKYFIYNNEMGEVQYKYEVGDTDITIRLKKTDGLTDISGLNYSWTYVNEGMLGDCPEKDYIYRTDSEAVQLCQYYVESIGVTYSVSAQAKDLDGFDIIAIAEQVAGAVYAM